MNQTEYQELVKKLTPKENKIKNILISFGVGGLVGLFGQLIITFLTTAFGFTETKSFSILALIIIFIGSLFTSLGFFDTWVTKCKCGLIIPTTGFAHSVTSSAIDYKKDGLITGLGSNFFKLAGSVILYGILSSFFLIILRVIING
jgi:stage V sporulation protein AC